MAEPYGALRCEVVDESDLVLFDEAVRCLEAGADRAASILVWIGAAEGLLNKLRQMADLDGELGTWVGKFEKAQENGTAKDVELVEKAASIGLLTKAEAISLEAIRCHRNLYGHPTATTPRHAEVVAALGTVVAAVLSKPPLIRHGGALALAKRVVEDPHFLPSPGTVQSFSERTGLIIEDARPGFILALLRGAESHLSGLNEQERADRCLDVAASVLELWEADLSDPAWKVDDLQRTMPAVTADVLARPGVWEHLASDDQDRIMSQCFDRLNGQQFLWEPARLLARADALRDAGLLSKDHECQLDEVLSRTDPRTLYSSGVDFAHVSRRITALLQKDSYRLITEAVELLRTVERDDLYGLAPALQYELGLSLGYGANRGGYTAQNEILNMSENLERWPLEVRKGVAAGGLAGRKRALPDKTTAMRTARLALTDPAGDLVQAAIDHLSEDHGQYMAAQETIEAVREILEAAPSSTAKDKLSDFLDRVATIPTAE